MSSLTNSKLRKREKDVLSPKTSVIELIEPQGAAVSGSKDDTARSDVSLSKIHFSSVDKSSIPVEKSM